MDPRAGPRRPAPAPSRKAAFVAVLSVAAAIAGVFAGPRAVLIFLPGTQPGTVDSVAPGGAAGCATCHSTQSPSREVGIFGDWSGSMMAHSARDPVFYAALAVANKYSAVTGDNTGEYCIRCHSPTGWLAARSEDITAGSLRGTDLDGVQCDYCHRAVDPLHPDSTVLPTVFPVPGYGNGMHMVQTSSASRRGPREIAPQLHPTVRDTFQADGALCGTCHDVSNPYQTAGSDRIDLPPHLYAPLERTYSEWLMSDYATSGPAGTCQGCHMGASPGYAAVNPTAPLRPDIHAHDLTGGNSFVPRILARFWDGLDTAALRRGAERAEATLRRAATLSVTVTHSDGGVLATVRVTNLTGHKLPTGYPEGRRMWLTVVATDTLGDTVFISGAYDRSTGTLTADSLLRSYEAVHGLTPANASRYGLTPGASLFFSLNDTILFDNRIPPKGFSNAAFASRLAAPVGASYADGVYWDDAAYHLPPSASMVSAALWYQSVSREYAEFLRDENDANPFDPGGWGRRLYAAWDSGGKSAPVLVDSLSVAVPGGDPTAAGPGYEGPGSFRLDPPWPNPFNGTVSIRFSVPGGSEASLGIFDITGRLVETIYTGRPRAGDNTTRYEAAPLSSGVYIVRLRSGTFFRDQKILLIR